MSILVVDHSLKNIEVLLKKVSRLTITLTKTEKQIIKRKRTVYHHTKEMVYDYWFDTVSVVGNFVVAKGAKSIVLYDIPEGYTLEKISTYLLNEDKEYECVLTNTLSIYYASGGTFTFDGRLKIEVSVNA